MHILLCFQMHFQVSDNGIISFLDAFNNRNPLLLPRAGFLFVTPYWADVDLIATGDVFYRQTNDSALLARSNREIQEAFPSSQNIAITNLFIVTWYGVGYYSRSTDHVRY